MKARLSRKSRMSRYTLASRRRDSLKSEQVFDDEGDPMPQPDIHKAAQSGDTEQLRALLRQSCLNVDEKDHGGGTALLAASSEAEGVKTIPLLLQAGANVNAGDLDGVTSLHTAAFAGFADTVQLLLEAGAEVDPKDVEGFTPLFLACLKGHTKVVEVLLTAGANPKVEVDDDGTILSAFEQAKENGHEGVVKLMKAALSSLK